MNFTPKFYKRGFFIFGIFNLAFLGVILFGPKPKPTHQMHLKHVIENLNEILVLDSKQKIALDQIFILHQKEIDSIKQIAHFKHHKIINCLKNENSSCDSALFVQPSFELILFKHHQRILKILNPRQKEKYILELKTKKRKDPPPPPF